MSCLDAIFLCPVFGFSLPYDAQSELSSSLSLTLVSHSHSHPLLALGSDLVMIDFDLYFDLAYWLGEFL